MTRRTTGRIAGVRGCGLALLALQAAASQADPYQFDLRSKFARESSDDERPRGLFVEPRIESALMFIGNINLAQTADEEVDVAAIEAAPGIYASYRSPRADALLDYSLIGRAFEEDVYNSVSHLLSAHGNLFLVQDWLSVRADAGYSDSIIDPTRSYNYGDTGLFDRQNITEVGRASVTPRLTHQFGGWVFDSSYSYGRVWYFENDDVPTNPIFFSGFNEDSEDQRFRVSLGTRDAARAATLRLFYDWQKSEYERTLPYEYERAGADTSLGLTRTLRLVADGGVETDLTETTTEGGLDATFWHAGLRWEPDSRTYFDARYGDRFFGDSYRFEFRRETRLLTVKASYREDPQVETRRVGIDFDPDDFPVPPPGADFSFFTSFPYISKDALLALIAEGARTKLRLDVYDRKREYIRTLSAPDERTTGARFNALRDIGSDLYGEFELRYDDVLRGSFSQVLEGPISSHTYDKDAMLRVTWEAYRNFLGSVEGGWFARSGDADYDGMWLAFRLRYTF